MMKKKLMPVFLFFGFLIVGVLLSVGPDAVDKASLPRHRVAFSKIEVIDTLLGKYRYGVFACWSTEQFGQSCGDPTNCGLSFSWKSSAESLAAKIRMSDTGFYDSSQSRVIPFICEVAEKSRKESMFMAAAFYVLAFLVAILFVADLAKLSVCRVFGLVLDHDSSRKP